MIKAIITNGAIVPQDRLPSDWHDGTEVAVEKCTEGSTEATASSGWPPGYFESTFGSITDESFVRPPQGELPKPVELE